MNKVYVFYDKSRRRFRLNYTLNGQAKRKTLPKSVVRRREAESIGQELEKEINQPQKIDCWQAACDEYAATKLAAKSHKYKLQFDTSCNKLQSLAPLDSLEDLTQNYVDQLTLLLNENLPSKSSAVSYLKTLRAFFNWLERKGYCQKLYVEMPRIDQTDAARGEPLTREEFVQILDAVPIVVESQRDSSMKDFLQGLWLSGFRLSELFNLSWSDPSQPHVLYLDTKSPVIEFPANSQKSRRAEIWSVPPDFANHLRNLQVVDTFVYKPLTATLKRYGTAASVGKVISKISERAGVQVRCATGLRYASANDIRRSFIQRWYEITGDIYAAQRMARHKSDVTTKRFYAREQASRFSERIAESYELYKQR